MCDAYESTMDTVFSSKNSVKPARRKSRHHSQLSDRGADPAFADMFQGVGELAPHDDGVTLTSQRSESDDRHTDPVQRQRSRASRSSGTGSSKKKATPSGAASSVTKRDSTPSSLAVLSGDLVQREYTTLARQQLTSSASRVRPVKLQQQPKVSRVTRQTSVTRDGESSTQNHHNNNEDNDEPVVEQAGGRGLRGVPSHHFSRGRAEWETLQNGMNQAGRLSTRSRRYLNQSAGSDGTLDPASADAGRSDEETSPMGGLHADRPPSRQCHAFPTHLLDPREFFSPNKHPMDGANGISMTPWHADGDEREEDDEDETVSPCASGPEEDSGTDMKQQTTSNTNQRPPSRYMVKPSRSGTSSSDTSSSPLADENQTRLPSRRGAAGSRNQAAVQCCHDPKTDGFLAVDESVPPPFRVEISTAANRGQYVASHHHRLDEERRHGLKSRRASSFGTRSQLKTLQQQDSNRQLEADGLAVKDAEATMGNRLVEPQWFQDMEPPPSKRVVESTPTPMTRQLSTKRSSRSIIQPNVSGGDNDNCGSSLTTQQWFRSSNNPFFVSPAVATGAGIPTSSSYADMDAETAIANTPLFTGEEDLMAMTQLTDLHLDDFLADPYVYNSTATVVGLGSGSTVVATSGAGTTTASASLHTSLGRDFLSLFAQH